MCTVSFISYKDTFFITSNRDEHISRPKSYEPKQELINNCKVIFPKDPMAGGTWIAANEHGVGAVLLNGAFEKHIRKGYYARSRGLILLDVISSKSPYVHLEAMDLNEIEPFTLILFDGKALVESRWDGIQRHRKELEVNEHHIWSSATLYTKEAISNRKRLFDLFVSSHNVFNQDNIIKFHSNNHNDFDNGFIINREETLKTFSITQLVFSNQNVTLNHHDLLKKEEQTLNV